VCEIWGRHFSQVKITETRFCKEFNADLLAECFEIAARDLKEGRQPRAFDEENLGEYIMGSFAAKQARCGGANEEGCLAYDRGFLLCAKLPAGNSAYEKAGKILRGHNASELWMAPGTAGDFPMGNPTV
jgi:hypothetical protein